VLHMPAPGSGQRQGTPIGFGLFSTRSGALLAALDKVSYLGTRPMTQQVLWTSAAGRGLLVQSPLPYWGRVALVQPDKISLLPSSIRISVPDVTW
jgi:hypothetical protein